MLIRVIAIALASTLPLLTPSYQPSLRGHNKLTFDSNGVTVTVRRIGPQPKSLSDDIIVRIDARRNGKLLQFEFTNQVFKHARSNFVDIEGKDATAFIVPRVTLPGHAPDFPVIVALTHTCGGSCGDKATAFEAHTVGDGFYYSHPAETYWESADSFQYAQDRRGARGRILRIHYAKRINGNTFLTGVYDRNCRSFALVVNYRSSMAERDAPRGKAIQAGDFLEFNGEFVRVIRPPDAFSCSRERAAF